MGPRLGYSLTSKRARRAPAPLSPELQAIRIRGHRGGRIALHRAFRRVQPSLADGCGAALLVLGFSAAWVRLLPLVGELWYRIFVFGVDAFALHSSVAPLEQRWSSRVQFSL